MGKYVYVNKDTEAIYVELDTPLDANSNAIGATWDDYRAGEWILLSEEQLAFKEEHPEASVEEVFNMEIRVIPLEPEPEKTLQDTILDKLVELYRYDASEAVNSFTLNGVPCWITAAERATYNTSIQSAETLKETTIEIPIAGQFFTLPIAQSKMMLAMIQRYADKAAVVTARHKAAIEALATAEEIEAYDFTAGYPEKITLSLQ